MRGVCLLALLGSLISGVSAATVAECQNALYDWFEGDETCAELCAYYGGSGSEFCSDKDLTECVLGFNPNQCKLTPPPTVAPTTTTTTEEPTTTTTTEEPTTTTTTEEPTTTTTTEEPTTTTTTEKPTTTTTTEEPTTTTTTEEPTTTTTTTTTTEELTTTTTTTTTTAESLNTILTNCHDRVRPADGDATVESCHKLCEDFATDALEMRPCPTAAIDSDDLVKCVTTLYEGSCYAGPQQEKVVGDFDAVVARCESQVLPYRSGYEEWCERRCEILATHFNRPCTDTLAGTERFFECLELTHPGVCRFD